MLKKYTTKKYMKATIKVYRQIYTNNTTIGDVYVNDKFICNSLEDKCRDLNRDGDLNDIGEEKIKNETAIPAGTYKVIINISPRFKKLLPRLLNVPGYDGVLIHAGNTKSDTSGCLLMGIKGVDCLLGGTSQNSLNKLMSELKKYDEYEIQIIDKK